MMWCDEQQFKNCCMILGPGIQNASNIRQVVYFQICSMRNFKEGKFSCWFKISWNMSFLNFNDFISKIFNIKTPRYGTKCQNKPQISECYSFPTPIVWKFYLLIMEDGIFRGKSLYTTGVWQRSLKILRTSNFYFQRR